MRRTSSSRCRSPSSQTRSTPHRSGGPSARTPTSSSTCAIRSAVTSPPGSSRRHSQPTCATRSAASADDQPGRNREEGAMTTDTGERGWLSRALGPPRSIAHRLPGDAGVLPVEGRLAPFDGASGWLNSAALTPAGLRGRVVLVDFWTYTCVNWLRTLPYVREWAARYAEDGLVVVGVHTPEFGFEHDQANVARQAATFGVTYPVALDNGYRVWGAFANHYWPAVYLADAEGRIRYHHFGEGEYAMTEMAIQQLLAESGR